MNTKEKIKEKIDQLPEGKLQEIDTYLDRLLQGKKRTDGLPTFDLGGKFDHIDIRKEAYE